MKTLFWFCFYKDSPTCLHWKVSSSMLVLNKMGLFNSKRISVFKCPLCSSMSEEDLLGPFMSAYLSHFPKKMATCMTLGHCWNIVKSVGIKVIARTHCCSSGNQDRCWNTLLQQLELRLVGTYYCKWGLRSLLKHTVTTVETKVIVVSQWP